MHRFGNHRTKQCVGEQVEGENPKWLEKAIRSAVESLNAAGVGDKGKY